MADRRTNPPPEAIAYLEAKGFKPGFHWQDIWGEEHAYAFTVAKATEVDVLSTLRREVARAVRDGVPFEAWRKDLEPTLKKLGWWGKQTLVDPVTGQEAVVQLGSPRRLKTIYWANTRTAYAAGQWERAQRTKAGLPYFIYELGPSENHRPHHVAWATRPTVLPVDHSFWDSHYPPNGWLCKCRLRQITRFEAEAIDGPTEPPQIKHKEFINKRSGEPTQVPVGIDPGWHTNPGKARARTLIKNLELRLEQSNEATARTIISDLWESRAPEALANVIEPISMPVAVSPRVSEIMNGRGNLVSVPVATINTKSNKHLAVGRDSFALVQSILDDGETIRRPDGSLQFWKKLDGKWWVTALRKTRGGFLRVATLFQSSESRLDSVRRVAQRLEEK